MKLETLLARGEAMHEELGLEYYLTGAGLKQDPAFHTIYDRYADVASDEALERARTSGSKPLVEWLVDVRVGRAVATHQERQLVWEQGAELEVAGRRIPFLRAPIEIANTPERDVRIALDSARARVGSTALNDVRRDRFRTEHDVIATLGMGTYVDAVMALSGIDLTDLARQAQDFLASTEAAYLDGLAGLARRRIGVGVAALVRSDAAWLFRADRFDDAFPSGALVETAAGQMREMGLDPTIGGRVRFDTEEREGKQARAFCAPVRVPHEVYLVLRPRGGHSDYRTFWHELGHAMHFASVSETLPFAARWLGDNSVTEGYAMLWDHLTLDRGWLSRYGGLSARDAAALAYELAVGELFLARRYAAKLSYERELHSSDLRGVDERYAELLSDATKFRYSADDYLVDVDPGFYSARYLRAWQLEAALSRLLVERYDEDWYRNPRAGGEVEAWMQRGQADTADEIAERVCRAPLSFTAVAERTVAVLE